MIACCLRGMCFKIEFIASTFMLVTEGCVVEHGLMIVNDFE